MKESTILRALDALEALEDPYSAGVSWTVV